MSDIVQNDQIMLKIIGDTFISNGHSVSTYITKKFKERQCPSGYTWKHVDQHMKDFYYKEFLKKYTWEPGHEAKFKDTWNLYCRKRYKALLYKWRNKKEKPFHVPDEIWDVWKKTWAAEQWQHNSIAARNNRNTKFAGKHTAGSRSIVEHAIVMEDTLQRPSNCWELFRNTHRRKDGTFIDLRSQAIDDQLVEKVAQASQQAIKGGELQTPSHNDINRLYYEVVGGRKKNSLYNLGSHAKVVFDMSTPRLKGGSSSSCEEALWKENAELRQQFRALEETLEDRVNEKVEERVNAVLQDRVNAAVEQSMQIFMARFMPSQPLMDPSCFPTPHSFASQETKDPNVNDE